MITEATAEILKKTDLSAEKMQLVMEEIMTGKAATTEIAAFLTALNGKGATIEELTAAVRVMRGHVTRVRAGGGVILDTCGTGGDTKGTFNISTAVAFVASGAGITVAKHGNRSVSSCCGSADILEALGVNINMDVAKIERCLNEAGIAFLFAPNLHPAMKYAMPARKQIGARTMFNILGPLSNPASATHQLVGVYDQGLTQTMAQVLQNLGTAHAMVVCGDDGLDEITTTAKTRISEVRGKSLRTYEVEPGDFGIDRSSLKDIMGGTVPDNAKILLDVLNSQPGPKRDIVVLNASAAIYAADRASSIKEAIKAACDSIDSGRALKKLELLREHSNK